MTQQTFCQRFNGLHTRHSIRQIRSVEIPTDGYGVFAAQCQKVFNMPHDVLDARLPGIIQEPAHKGHANYTTPVTDGAELLIRQVP